MYLEIKCWNGRLGNNIEQLKNIIITSNYNKINIIIPTHKYFNKKKIILFDILNNENKISYDKKNFMSLDTIKIEQKKGFEIQKIKITKTYNISVIKKNIEDLFINLNINKYNDKTLIIYIRSGDLFPESDEQKVHKGYISAPYYYYEYILNKYKNNYKDFILVAEDNRNPVIKKLLKNHSYIKWTQNTLDDDLKIILGAYDIVSCIGTFIQSLSWVSKNMKKVYLPSYVRKKNYYPELEIEKIDLYDFKEKIGPWKNTKEQHNLLLNFVPIK